MSKKATNKTKKLTKDTTNDEELLKAFIGKNYENITKNPFNIPAFFFTSLQAYGKFAAFDNKKEEDL